VSDLRTLIIGYPIEIERDDDTWLITSPAFPEVLSFAEDIADVPARARDAIEEALAARFAYNEPTPAMIVRSKE
jgi:antitoxin HicB